MSKVLLLAGTSEGRELARRLHAGPAQLLVSVATLYGRELLDLPASQVLCGRLDGEQMAQLLCREQVTLAIDATHPYAVEVTDHLRTACELNGIPYLRLLRGEGEHRDAWAEVPTPEAAAECLCRTSGGVLLTTGSKDLAVFATIPDFRKRLFVRILPAVESIAHCLELGIAPSHILALQGPFSQEFNEALLKHVGAEYLVTKASGEAGGFEEKLAAATWLGVKTLVITRPRAEQGMTWPELLSTLGQMGLLN